MKHIRCILSNRSVLTLTALVILLAGLLIVRTVMDHAQPVVSQRTPDSGDTPIDAQSVSGTGDFFKDFRAQRETARADEIALLDTIIQRPGAPEESIREADARKIQLTQFTEQERAIEKLLVAKGFEDVAAFVQESTVSIAVKQEKLSDEENAKILALAIRQTDQQAANIKIIPVAPD